MVTKSKMNVYLIVKSMKDMLEVIEEETGVTITKDFFKWLINGKESLMLLDDNGENTTWCEENGNTYTFYRQNNTAVFKKYICLIEYVE